MFFFWLFIISCETCSLSAGDWRCSDRLSHQHISYPRCHDTRHPSQHSTTRQRCLHTQGDQTGWGQTTQNVFLLFIFKNQTYRYKRFLANVLCQRALCTLSRPAQCAGRSGDAGHLRYLVGALPDCVDELLNDQIDTFETGRFQLNDLLFHDGLKRQVWSEQPRSEEAQEDKRHSDRQMGWLTHM